METDFVKGAFVLDDGNFEYILNTTSFEIVVFPCSPRAFEKSFVGTRLDNVLIGSIDNGERKIAFCGIYFYSLSLLNHKGKVELFAIYGHEENVSKENESRMYFRGKSADYLSIISRASNIKHSPDSISLVPLSEFCFLLNISEHEKVEIAYEKVIKFNHENENNQMICSGLETLIIKEKSVSIANMFGYYKSISLANKIVTNSMLVSFTATEFEIIDSGQLLKGKILCFANKENIKQNYQIRDFNNYIEGVEKVFQESFANEFGSTNFLRDEFGDCFSYDRQFKLFSSFDYYFKKSYKNLTFSDPTAMVELKTDLLNFIDSNVNALTGKNRKKIEYVKSLKRAIKNYDIPMSEMIKRLVFENFIQDEEAASKYSRKMNEYRNCIVHGRDFQKNGNELINSDEVTYWDFVMYERLLLYIALIKYKNSFDLALFCKQLYAF